MCGCERHSNKSALCSCLCEHSNAPVFPPKAATEDERLTLVRTLIEQESDLVAAKQTRAELEEARDHAVGQEEKLQALIGETRNRLGEALRLIDGSAKAMSGGTYEAGFR